MHIDKQKKLGYIEKHLNLTFSREPDGETLHVDFSFSKNAVMDANAFFKA